jgi:hypothetical protein
LTVFDGIHLAVFAGMTPKVPSKYQDVNKGYRDKLDNKGGGGCKDMTGNFIDK